MDKIRFKRLSIDIPLNIHKEIQRNAKKRNITITRFVTRVLIEKLIKDEWQYEKRK